MVIEHTALYVSELETARDFFVKYFGAVSNDGYHNQKTGFRSYFLTFEGGSRLEIMTRPDITRQDKPPYRTGWAHIAFSAGSREAVDDIAQGRVWSGKEALGIGLADEKGTLLDAIEYTAKQIKLSDYRIEAYPEKLSFKDQLRGKQEKKKDPLVWVKEHMHPGFNAMALMPYFTIDPVKTIE